MNLFQKVSDWAATAFGSPWFFVFHIVWWGFWVTHPVEPFPYGLLTLIVSLESILLSGLILNATNRAGDVDRLLIHKDSKTNRSNLEIDRETNEMVNKILVILEEKNGNKL